MKRILVVLLLVIAVGSVGTWYVTRPTQSSVKPIQNDPSCSFMLYGEMCSNVPQGGGGTLHAVYM